jgi:hypothetical protein
MAMQSSATGSSPEAEERRALEAAAADAGAELNFAQWLELVWSEVNVFSTAEAKTDRPPRLPLEARSPPPAALVGYLAHFFRYPDDTLADYAQADAQHIVFGLSNEIFGEPIHALRNAAVPEALRCSAAEAMADFLCGYMSRHAAPLTANGTHESDHPPPEWSAFNWLLYMWWDVLPYSGDPAKPHQRTVDAALLGVMRRQLGSTHPGVRESGIHGLGHWQYAYPDEVHAAIDAHLAASVETDPRMLAYARAARRGAIQ